MKKKQPFEFSPEILVYPLLFVLAIWMVFWVEVTFGFDFNYLGIRPRTLIGLRGILFAPFIHANIKHLFSNTIPLFVLSMALFFFYRKISWQIIILGMLFTGLITWGIGRPAEHIGASGLIYVIASFLFFKGIFSKYYRLMALSFIVVFLYGGLVWFVMPGDPTISWEGHLSGFIVGLAFSVIYTEKIEKPVKYEWEKEEYDPENDDFMKYFDEEGNFRENIPEDEPGSSEGVEVKYEFRENKNDS
ncbi:MAG: rhomboid family intramembrane serine protease [Gillisia sp.]